MFTPYKDYFLKLYVKGPLWGRSISMGYTEYAVARSIAMIVFYSALKIVIYLAAQVLAEALTDA